MATTFTQEQVNDIVSKRLAEANSKAEKKLKLVRMENNSFFSAIRNKLMWGTNLRNTNKND